jgi:DNA-binding NarL/FixJ family response regulator
MIKLTRRQKQSILALWETGGVKEAGHKLGLSQKTVGVHLHDARAALGHPEWSLVTLALWVERNRDKLQEGTDG